MGRVGKIEVLTGDVSTACQESCRVFTLLVVTVVVESLGSNVKHKITINNIRVPITHGLQAMETLV
jgi:hypothetical protein